MGAKASRIYSALRRPYQKLKKTLVKHPLLPLHEVLSSAVVRPAVDPAHNLNLGIAVCRADLHPGCHHMLIPQRNHPSENKQKPSAPLILPVRDPHTLAVFQIQSSLIFMHSSPAKGQRLPVQINTHICHIGEIGKLRHLAFAKPVEGPRHKQIPYLPGIPLLQSAPHSQITVALTEDRLIFVKTFLIKPFLGKDPPFLLPLPNLIFPSVYDLFIFHNRLPRLSKNVFVFT